MGGQYSRIITNYGAPINEEHPGQSQTIRHPDHTDELVTSPEVGLNTVFDILLSGFYRYTSSPMFGTKQGDTYNWKSYGQIKDRATFFGSSITNLDLAPAEEHVGRTHRFIGIYGKNDEAWGVTDIASALFGVCSVPLYDTLGPEAIEHILYQTNMKTVVLHTGSIKQLTSLKEQGRTSALEVLVSIEDVTEQDKANAGNYGLTLYSMEELVEMGRKNVHEYIPPSPNDLFTICYTSGTTGLPKGVMLSHGNIAAQIGGVIRIVNPTNEDIHISYLPLAHIYERILMLGCLYCGASIGFYGGDVFKLSQDLQALKPTIFPCVPRLLQRFYDRIKAGLDGLRGPKYYMAQKAIAAKIHRYRTTGIPTHSIYDGLVFNRIKNILGGRVRIGVSASAPISQQILTFLRIAFCCPICEGYGQTEVSGASTATQPGEQEAGHVGGPVPSCEVKLQDIPQMNYLSTDRDDDGNPMPRGQICIRGPSVCQGYFKLPKETSETIDSEGWLHSGDVGVLLPNNSIKIIDRKKNIFKLAQGEYVAPEKIENVYVKSKYAALVFVHGDSLEFYLVGVVCPEQSEVEPWAAENGIEGSWEELCQNKQVKDMILEDLTNLGRAAKLTGFEQVKKLYLHPQVLTPQSGLLTPTFKVKRYDARNYFESQLKAMYAEGLQDKMA